MKTHFALLASTCLVVLWLGPLGCGKSATSSTSYLCAPACPTGTRCTDTGCVAESPPDLGAGAADLSVAEGCTPACAGNTPYCNNARVCVPCLTDDNCPTGQLCKPAGAITACLPGCNDDARCQAGGGSPTARCCNNQCVESSSDPANCGGCGTVCGAQNASPLCQAGACAVGDCFTGWSDCNKDATDGCEANVNADASNCGSCGQICKLPNATAACSAGCYVKACNFGFDDCNSEPKDGCETSVLSDAKNCGACGSSCQAVPHARPTCINASCQLASCDQGWSNCDGDPRNGCEVNTFGDAKNCGGCGMACDPGLVCKNGGCTCPQCNFDNATSSCINNVCTLVMCNPGWGNCNNLDKDGCEVDLTHDDKNCSACGMACPQNLPNCVMGACALEPQLVGKFRVSDGPAWGGNPPCYTCLEACALLFGGDAADYACSTSDKMIDHKASLDGWGDSKYCAASGGQPQAEDFKKSMNYNCGAGSCSFSAYVMDHSCQSLNYCYK